MAPEPAQSIRKVNCSGFYWSKRWWGGSGISWTMCKSSAPRSRQITTPVPRHSSFYRRDALPAAQPTASKHWRQKKWSVIKGKARQLNRNNELACLAWAHTQHSPLCWWTTAYPADTEERSLRTAHVECRAPRAAPRSRYPYHQCCPACARSGPAHGRETTAIISNSTIDFQQNLG